MSDINFSSLQQNTTASNTEQFLMRLDNALSGADGFARISKLNVEKSLGVYSTMQSKSANWDNTYTNFSAQSANNASVYSTMQSESADWQSVYTTVQSNSANNWSGGLTLFTTVSSAVTPNNARNVHALSATSTQTNVDVAIIAKGAGATLAQIPNGVTSGGVKRGIYATDLQKIRDSLDRVASGDYSVIAGGRSNRAASTYSTCIGGHQNVSTEQSSTIAGGEANTASGVYSVVVGGYGNQSSGGSSTVGGGASNSANGTYSVVPGGYGAVASVYGQYAFGSSYFENPGDAQHFQFVLYGVSTDGNAVILDQQANSFPDASASYVSLFPNIQSAVAIMTIQIIGIESSGSISYYLKKIIVSKLVSASYNEVIVLDETLGGSASTGGSIVVGINTNTSPNHAFYISGSSTPGARTRWTAHVSGVYVVQPPAYT